MFGDKGNYLIIDELKKEGVAAGFTDKGFGDMREILESSKETDVEELLRGSSSEGRKFVFSKQTHSKNIAVIEEESPLYFENIDGFVTKRRDIILVTIHADCLPIYFYDRKKNVIGICHSGWKGSFDEIGGEVLKKFRENYGSGIEDIIVAFGIGISVPYYEVGDEFYEEFKNRFPSGIIEKAFFKIEKKWHFDNEEFNFWMLRKKGILPGNIIRSGRCTFGEERFHSYRREGKDAGRNGAFIYFER